MEDLEIKVSCTPLSHLCRVNEKVEFLITANKDVPLDVVISVDGEAVIEKRTVMPPAKITSSLPFPGFLRCSVKSGTLVQECGVGVDPDQIQPLMQEPLMISGKMLSRNLKRFRRNSTWNAVRAAVISIYSASTAIR